VHLRAIKCESVNCDPAERFSAKVDGVVVEAPRRPGNEQGLVMLATLPPAAASAELSALNITRQAAALYRDAGSERFLIVPPAMRAARQQEYDALLDRAEALRHVGFMTPGTNLADAAAHLALASHEMTLIAGWEMPSDLRTLREGRVIAALVHALPFAASAAGIPLADICCTDDAPEIEAPGFDPPPDHHVGPWCRRDKLRTDPAPV
jgi:hypothetical protein